MQTELGLAEAAVARFRRRPKRPIARRSGSIPASLPAYLELGLLLENLEPARRARGARRRGGAGRARRRSSAFLQAWALRRQGRFAEALPLAQADARARSTRSAARQLLAELYDRLGQAAAAFAAFDGDEPRRRSAATPAPPGPSYREQVAAARGAD